MRHCHSVIFVEVSTRFNKDRLNISCALFCSENPVLNQTGTVHAKRHLIMYTLKRSPRSLKESGDKKRLKSFPF